jgi:hypothetical protein
MKYLTLAFLASSIALMPATAEVPDQATEKQDPSTVICKTDPKPGTRFASKTCKTRAQWDQMAEEHKRAASELVAGALPRVCDDPKEGC